MNKNCKINEKISRNIIEWMLVEIIFGNERKAKILLSVLNKHNIKMTGFNDHVRELKNLICGRNKERFYKKFPAHLRVASYEIYSEEE